MTARFSAGVTAASGALLILGTFGAIGAGLLYLMEEQLTVLAYSMGLISLAVENLILDNLAIETAVIAVPVLAWMAFRVFAKIWSVEINLAVPVDGEPALVVEGYSRSRNEG